MSELNKQQLAAKKLDEMYAGIDKKEDQQRFLAEQIVKYFKDRISEDEGLAEDILKPEKTWDKCNSYLYSMARKAAKGKKGYYASDSTIFEWAEDYFREEAGKEQKKPGRQESPEKAKPQPEHKKTVTKAQKTDEKKTETVIKREPAVIKQEHAVINTETVVNRPEENAHKAEEDAQKPEQSAHKAEEKATKPDTEAKVREVKEAPKKVKKDKEVSGQISLFDIMGGDLFG